jgi:hypothetical protein
MLSRSEKARFVFLELPETLQDALIGALDSHALTIKEAEARARGAGHQIGKSSIARYYEALRRERRALLLEVMRGPGGGP